MADNFYCGAGPVPKGKVRGSAEYCYNNNQVRYWGLHKIDKSIIEAAAKAKKETDVNAERAKRLKLRDEMRKLVSEVTMVNLQMEVKGVRESELKRLKKKKEGIVERRNKLLARIKKQDKVLEALEKNASAEKKTERKKTSGSKTSSTSTKKSVSEPKKSSVKSSSVKKASGSKTSSTSTKKSVSEPKKSSVKSSSAKKASGSKTSSTKRK